MIRYTILALLLGCRSTPTPNPAADAPSQVVWTTARSRLAALRATESTRPYAVVLRVAFREPGSGKVVEARGALAVRPHDAMRMILVGPGGATALDLWVTREKWRFVVPAADFKRSGGTGSDDARGLPIGFFRWWFLAPLDGRLLSAAGDERHPTLLLRDAGSTIIVRDLGSPAGAHLIALRREAKDGHALVEALEWMGADLAPRSGDRARYVQSGTWGAGLEVEVLVETVVRGEPDPAAFEDPEASRAEEKSISL
jgi:hypothetical protein